MKRAWMLAFGLFVGLSVGGSATAADDWSWTSDRKSAEQSPSPTDRSKPSWYPAFNPLAPLRTGARAVDRGVKRVDAGIKKLGTNTRRVFAEARDVLTGNRPEPKPGPTTPRLSWVRPAKPQTPKRDESSWLGSWFQREEPRPSSSVADFMSAKRLDP